MEIAEDNYLAHYGILRKSGRYPWGSGKDPLQRSKTFLDIVKEHKKAGLSEAQIADLYQPKDENGKKIPPYFTTADLRALKSRAVHEEKQDLIRQAQRMRDKAMSDSAIGRQLGKNESSIRSLLAPGRQEKLDTLRNVADMLKQQVEEKEMIDVGSQVQRALPLGDNPNVRIGISRDKFNTALSMLKEEGYPIHTLRTRQQGTGEFTRRKVLVKPGITQKHAFLNQDKIQVITKKSDDGGRTFEKDLEIKPPLNIDSKRVGIRYKEDGGADHDGVIYVRPGVPDISLGQSHYAQVRIAVDGTHYLKGMAIYKNDLPKGVDLQFNTNKSNTGNKLDALKKMKTDKDGNVDPKNPFGADIKLGGQIKDDKGNVTSSMNKIHEEGDWNNWSRTVSAQVLSKQPTDLAKAQLGLTYDRRRQEFEKIKDLTNPEIKKKLLESFSDETDSAAVHLKAANMPRQATKVILPLTTIKEHEVFAPTFKNGERVALIRFPHAGLFEIPELTVNNNNREAKALFREGKGKQKLRAPDAIGIHPKVAEHLSGADFDGDHVVVIPNNRGAITKTRPLDGLKGFDPQQYKVPTPDEDPVNGRWTLGDDPKKRDPQKQNQMGQVTNLISDMTIKGASTDELARAVRHSMVVIDSEKHNLDYKASAQKEGIRDLKRKYQGRTNPETGRLNTGAATLVTRATARKDVPKRRAARAGEGGPINPETGAKRFVPTGETDKHGNIKRFRSRRLAETNDAFTLVSEGHGTDIEKVYAEHSNKLKALANEARKEMISTPSTKRQPSAAKVYETEVSSLKAKLNDALKNAPLERQAHALTASIVSQTRKANPDMDKAEVKKVRGRALDEARLRTGAKKDRIPITDREWEAIQSGAISSSLLKDILRNTDVDQLRERATPRNKPVITKSIETRAKNLLNNGATPSEVADALGIKLSTLESAREQGGW